MLTRAGLVAVTQGSEDADGGIHPAHDICDAHANFGGHAVGIAGQ